MSSTTNNSTIDSQNNKSCRHNHTNNDENEPCDLTHKSKQVGYVYDIRMVNHMQLAAYQSENEIPLRIFSIFQTLKENGFIDKMKRIPARLVTNEELLNFHTLEYVQQIQSVKTMNKDELVQMSRQFDDLYLSSESEYCARLACGGVIELVNEIILNQLLSGIAIVRPPGHHAEANQAMGFCIFNNVAVAVSSLKKKYDLKRILIVDWDVHYGNGIQKAFNSDPNVVYISLHRYENATFYPRDKTGALTYVGEAGGLGCSVNVAWTRNGMGDGDYLYAFDEIVIPIGKEFEPEVVVVASGFDAADGDELGECNITPLGYAQLTRKLTQLANGKVAICLEGGYNLQSISSSAMACVQVLLNDIDVSDAPQPPPSKDCVQVIDDLKRVQKTFWKCIEESYEERVKYSIPFWEKQPEANSSNINGSQNFASNGTRAGEHRIIEIDWDAVPENGDVNGHNSIIDID